VRGRLDESTLPQAVGKTKLKFFHPVARRQRSPSVAEIILLSGGFNLFSSALLGW